MVMNAHVQQLLSMILVQDLLTTSWPCDKLTEFQLEAVFQWWTAALMPMGTWLTGRLVNLKTSQQKDY